MGLADLITDGAAASLINKADQLFNRYDLDTLEAKAHIEMLGNLESRVLDAGYDYIKSYGDELAQSAKDAGIKLGRDAAGALGTFVKKNLNIEDKINKVASDILDTLSFDNIAGGGLSDITNKKSENEATVGLLTDRRNASRGKNAFSQDGKIIELQKTTARTRTYKKGETTTDYPRLIEFLKRLTSNDPTFKLMHKYFFMVTINFKRSSNPSPLKLDDYINHFSNNNSTDIQLLSRRAELPHLQSEHTTIKNEFGHMSLPGKVVIPSENSFILGFLSTEFSIHETLMLEWLKQTTSDMYNYYDFPFMKAEINIDFFDQGFKQKILTYRFVDCFPQNIALLDPNYEDTSLTPRDVRFVFDYMKVIKHNDIPLIAKNDLNINIPNGNFGDLGKFSGFANA